MTLETRVTGIAHRVGHIKLEQSMHKKDGGLSGQGSGTPGAIVYTEPMFDQFTTVTPLLNDTVGADMNVNVTFAGSTTLIHDGSSGASIWDTSSVGAWVFDSGGKIVIDGANNNDVATFEHQVSTDMASNVAVTGKVDLDTYNDQLNTITLQLGSGGTAFGNSVNINEYIDTGDFTEQNFTVPTEDFNLSATVIDEMNLTITRAGGAKPVIKFDDFQIENTGTPVVFKYQPLNGQTRKLIAIRTIMSDGTAGTSDFSTILGVSELTNGIGVSAQSNGKQVFSGAFTKLGDFLQTPNTQYEDRVGNVNTWLTINTQFADNQVILKGDQKDNITYQINDDLSGLSFFRVFVTVTEDF